MKCGNCKHYEPIIFPPSNKLLNGEWGMCQQVVAKKNQAENNSISFTEGSSYNCIVVGRNFGCIHFENKGQ